LFFLPLQEQKKKAVKSFMQQYLELLSEGEKVENEDVEEVYDFDEKNVTMEATINKLFNKVDDILDDKKKIITEETEEVKPKNKTKKQKK